MRTLLIGAALFVLSLFGPMVLERIMSGAPDLVWRWVSFVCAVCGVAIVLSSDLVLPHLKSPSSSPFVSTLIVTVAAAVICGSGWWFLLAARSSGADQVQPGLRLLAMEFSIPVVGAPVEAIVSWENTAHRNITAHGHATVYEIGLAENEQLPIRRDTEDAFEEFGWQQQQAGPPRDNATEMEPGSRVITRHTSDPANPLTQEEINEIQAGRARVYVVGEQHWNIDGVEHGCDYCAWTSGDGRANLCHQRNRCY